MILFNKVNDILITTISLMPVYLDIELTLSIKISSRRQKPVLEKKVLQKIFLYKTGSFFFGISCVWHIVVHVYIQNILSFMKYLSLIGRYMNK